MAFNANEHLTNLKGKDYLEVKWRLVWFRDEHPHGVITTEMIHVDIEKGVAIFKACIDDAEGGHAEGHGSESKQDFGDYIEKAETKAIGRALAALSYGTQFAPELEEGARIVDSPVARRASSGTPNGNGNGARPNLGSNQGNTGNRPAPEGDTPSNITEQQIASIGKLSERLGKIVPTGINNLSFDDGATLLQQLTKEYREKQQKKQQSSNQKAS